MSRQDHEHEQLQQRIIEHLRSEQYRPLRPRRLARQLNVAGEEHYPAFREALRELMRQGRVVLGAGGNVVLPTQRTGRDEFTGTYRHNRRGFGFVVPLDPESHEDLYIPPGENNGALTGDIVRARITSRGQRDGRTIYTGRVIEIVERTNKRFAGTLVRIAGQWAVNPDGNTLTEPILTPDAASRHIRPGTKVVVEITSYPQEPGQWPQGVITEVLGRAGDKDVDLKSVIVQFNLPEKFPDRALAEARHAVDSFDVERERRRRLDLTDQVICTIDPDDAKDFDDAISLRQVEHGHWELGVHIADVSFFVRQGAALDQEARQRGNSTYFPGFVIPMLPEILSNGVCSLQEGVPRLCKSVFITFDDDARPIRTRFANSIIKSSKRLRYREAQAIIDGAGVIPHPEGDRVIGDYPPQVVKLLGQMNTLARRIQKRRLAQGQLVLDLPEVELVLDENGRVVDAVPEDTSFTHTLIEMFMVEANEAVARLLDSLNVPFLRRIHPEPDLEDMTRLRHFTEVAGYRLPKVIDRYALQRLLESVKGKPEAFAINLAVLKSLTRAEYSPLPIGHYALASEHYCHFTSPIRRYADLTIHRLLDAYFHAIDARFSDGPVGRVKGGRKGKVILEDVPDEKELLELGRHLSFTERRSEDAEQELRRVKLLELLSKHIGDEFTGVVTGITNFGIFVQLTNWLIDGLIRYEDLLDDWWEVDEQAGRIRGQRTGQRIGIGDVARVIVVKVDLPRRELDLSVRQILPRHGAAPHKPAPPHPHVKAKHKAKHGPRARGHAGVRGGGSRRRRPPRRRR
ncbi:ribonuclease R [Fontivita pretiosa]|uniref:ribonuclease R n=1 Tax=Fontivita pretiosa TaxID=2989684 RepID=UPI003D17AF57